MQIRSKLTKTALAALLTFSFAHANAIEIDTSTAEADLARVLAETLIIPNSGVTITSSTYSGNSTITFEGGGEDGGPDCEIDSECEDFSPPNCDGEICVVNDGPQVFSSIASPQNVLEQTLAQAGLFTNASGTYGLPSDGGVVFSTGNVADYADGPNNSGSNTTGYGVSATEEQNALLTPLSGRQYHNDVVSLTIEFDVADSVDTISFLAAFGSEEYPNYTSSSFIDAFGLFFGTSGSDELINVAAALETDAAPGQAPKPINVAHPDFAPIEGTELNGMLAPNGSPILRFDVPVAPNSTGNIFKFILADTSDSSFDTTIFLSSFGNFDSENGESEFTPSMPDPSNPTNEDGAFVFDLPEVEQGETIWFDPEIAVGYVYEATDGGLFASVSTPSSISVNNGKDALGNDNPYYITYVDANGIEQTVKVGPSEKFDFPNPVSTFQITGINSDLMLDPDDFTAFVTGVSFTQAGQFQVTQQAITQSTEVSAPGTLMLFAMTLIGVVSLRKRRRT